MVISEETYKRILERASEQMLKKWLSSHGKLAIETERRLCKLEKEVFASGNEHDVWMLWLYLRTRNVEVYVIQKNDGIYAIRKLTVG